MEEKKLNQILSTKESINKASSDILSRNKKKNFFKFQFIFCSITALIITGYYFYLQYDKNQKEALSSEILSRFSITNLYENTTNSNYSVSLTSNEYQSDLSRFFCNWYN